MLKRMLRWTAAAVLASASFPALAAGEACTASVCGDPTFPATENLAPAIVLEQHVDTDAIETKQAVLATEDKSVAEYEEAPHLHRYASLEDVIAMSEEP
ncbi:MAG TPA: hypothetical protein VIV57_10225 [Anaeromyxobacter sp.]